MCKELDKGRLIYCNNGKHYHAGCHAMPDLAEVI